MALSIPISTTELTVIYSDDETIGQLIRQQRVVTGLQRTMSGTGGERMTTFSFQGRVSYGQFPTYLPDLCDLFDELNRNRARKTSRTVIILRS
jgi:hypothetical protein